MNKQEIIYKLIEIFKVSNPNFEVKNIHEKSRLKEDLNMTSLSMMYLVFAIENEFDVDMSEVSFNTFETVNDVVDYILKNHE